MMERRLIPLKRLVCLLACLILFGACASAEQTMPVRLYLPDFEDNLTVTRDAEILDSPQGIIGALTKSGALPAGVRVLSFDEDTGRLDLSRGFSKALEKAGVRKEPLIMGALVNSFLDLYTLPALTVTCEGKTIKTALTRYDQPLTRYEAQAYTIRLHLSDLSKPEITVTVGDDDCSYAMAKVGVAAHDGVVYDAETMFPQIACMCAPVYSAAPGATVEIRFRDQPADSATLQDFVLNRDGSVKEPLSAEPVPLELKDGGSSFILQANPAARLGSDSRDCLSGAVLRGFLLTCRWGDTQYQYAFMLYANAYEAESDD